MIIKFLDLFITLSFEVINLRKEKPSDKNSRKKKKAQ